MKPEDLLRQEPQDYSTIYIDMDSFFASVEQYHEPRLRGKPVGVATGTSQGASIIAASYSAKKCGIHTGTKVEEALKVCPDIAIVHGNHKRYKEVHYAIMAILHGTICQVQAKGIDEAWLKVPSYARDREQVFALCKAIKSSIYDLYNEHINCSIGIASNIWLAKMAASRYKPNGFGCVCLADLPEFYHGVKLIALKGIGRRMVHQFATRGITTPSSLYREEWRSLGKHYGVIGQKWYLRMRGYEVDRIPLPGRKSLGH